MMLTLLMGECEHDWRKMLDSVYAWSKKYKIKFNGYHKKYVSCNKSLNKS